MVYLISTPYLMDGVVEIATIKSLFGESSVLPLSGWLCLLRSDKSAKEILKALQPSFNETDPVFIFEASSLLASFCAPETRAAVAQFLPEPEEARASSWDRIERICVLLCFIIGFPIVGYLSGGPFGGAILMIMGLYFANKTGLL